MRFSENLAWLPVAALALSDKHGRLLLQRRPEGKHHAGMWEFPGGKVEPGEAPRAALVREVREELGLVLDAADLAPVSFAEEGEPPVLLLLYAAHRWRGTIVATEGQAWAWHDRRAAAELELAPMDRHLLARLGD